MKQVQVVKEIAMTEAHCLACDQRPLSKVVNAQVGADTSGAACLQIGIPWLNFPRSAVA